MKTCVFHSMVVGLLMLTGCQSPQLASALSKKPGLSDDKVSETTGKGESSDRLNDRVRNADQVGAVRFSGGNSADLNSGVELMHRNVGSSRRGDSKWVNDNLSDGDREFKQGRLDQAKTYYRMVLEEQPDHPTAHHRLAVIADMQQNFRLAEHHYQTALKGSPTDATVLSDLGWSYILQHRDNDAETVLSEALAFDRTHRKALDRLGYLYGQRGDYDRALEMFRRASTQAAAQAKIAKLFPNGRPLSRRAPAQSLPSPVGNQNLGAPSPNQGMAGALPYAGPNAPGAPLAPAGNVGYGQGVRNSFDRGLQQQTQQQAMNGFATQSPQVNRGPAIQQAPYAAFPGDTSYSRSSDDTPVITPRRIGPAAVDPSNATTSFRNGMQTGLGNFGQVPNSTGTTPGLQGGNTSNQSARPGQQNVQPAAFEKSDSNIQHWPYAPKEDHLQPSQQPPQSGQNGLAPAGAALNNATSRPLPLALDAQSADSRRAAFVGMNAGPSGMLPIGTGWDNATTPGSSSQQAGSRPQVNGLQSAAPANAAAPWPASPFSPGSNGSAVVSAQRGMPLGPSQQEPGRAYQTNRPTLTTTQMGTGVSAPTSLSARQIPESQMAWPARPAPTITPGPASSRASLSSDLNEIRAGAPGSQLPVSPPTRNDATLYGAPRQSAFDANSSAGGENHATLPTSQYNFQQYNQPQQYNPSQQSQSQYNQPQQQYQRSHDAQQYGHQSQQYGQQYPQW